MIERADHRRASPLGTIRIMLCETLHFRAIVLRSSSSHSCRISDLAAQADLARRGSMSVESVKSAKLLVRRFRCSSETLRETIQMKRRKS